MSAVSVDAAIADGRSGSRARITGWLAAIAGAAALVALYVVGSAAFPLSEPDEARYAEIAREMLETGDWVTPHLNYVKYFEKPPLVYWATALSFAVFGPSELAARVTVVVGGLVTVALTAWLAAAMYGGATALLAVPVLALSPLFAVLAQALTLDMSLTCFMTAALAALWRGWSMAGTTQRRWYRAAYAATAAAVLVKGPVAALLVGAVAGAFLLLQGGWRALRPLFDWRGALLATVIAMPWFLLVSWRNPEFARYFIVDQHIARYLWSNEHDQALWFYVVLIPPVLGPWAIAVLLDPQLATIGWPPRRWTAATRFLVLWAAIIVAFFSFSNSKLLTYVLPALPPLAILTGRAWYVAIRAGRVAGLSRIGVVLLVAGPVMSLCGVLLPLVIAHWRMPLIAPTLFAGGPVLFATGWALRRALRRQRPLTAYAAMTVGWFLLIVVAVTGRSAANEYRALGLAAGAALQPGDRLAIYGSYVQGVPFYARHRAIMIVGKGELTFGSLQGDQSAFFWPSADELRREWAAPGRLFLVIKPAVLASLAPPLDPPPLLLAEKNDKVLVVNRR